MGAKLNNDLSPMKNNPGPGNYELQNRDNINMRGSQKFSVGTSQRIAVVAKSLS